MLSSSLELLELGNKNIIEKILTHNSRLKGLI